MPFNEGWGEWDLADTGRIADDVKNQDPTRLVNAHSGVNCCDSHGDPGNGDVDRLPQLPRPGSPRADGDPRRVSASTAASACSVASHEWPGDGFALRDGARLGAR